LSKTVLAWARSHRAIAAVAAATVVVSLGALTVAALSGGGGQRRLFRVASGPTSTVPTESTTTPVGRGGPTSTAPSTSSTTLRAYGRTTSSTVPKHAQFFESFAIPDTDVKAPPCGITSGSDGALSFINKNSEIWRITTAGALALRSRPAGAGSLCHITATPDGALWFTDSLGVSTPGGFVNANFSTTGPDGAVWFAGSSSIGRLDPLAATHR
jgi:streptogramin lyase